MKPRFKWLHAPTHGGSVTPAVIRRAKQSNALVIDWTEMYRNIKELKQHCPGYDHFVGAPGHTDPRGRDLHRDVIISTRDDAVLVHDEEFFVDSAIKRILKYHPERWGKARVIKYQGQIILIIVWHPQPSALKLVNMVLPHYKASCKRVLDVHDRLVAAYAPDLVLAGGDLQMRPGKPWYRPNKMAQKMGLAWANVKIDWQMWSKAWKSDEDWTIDPSKINKGMDHIWMVRILEKK